MSVYTAMTAIADKIRALLGISGTMGVEAMSANLETLQGNVADAFTAVAEMGGNIPESQIAGNLAAAIQTITTGVTVQRVTGSFITDYNGTCTVECEFKPDLVFVHLNEGNSGDYYSAAFAFAEESRGTRMNTAMWSDNENEAIDLYCIRSETGFNLSAYVYPDGTTYGYSGTFQYTAVKYSE